MRTSTKRGDKYEYMKTNILGLIPVRRPLVKKRWLFVLISSKAKIKAKTKIFQVYLKLNDIERIILIRNCGFGTKFLGLIQSVLSQSLKQLFLCLKKLFFIYGQKNIY